MIGTPAKSNLRAVPLIVALFFSTLGEVVSQTEGIAEPQPSLPGEAGAVTSGSTRPTLEELKAAGSSQSAYRNASRTRQTKNWHPRKPNLTAFRNHVQPVLKEVCLQCHGSETQEGNIRVDTLDPDLFDGSDVNWWLEVLAVLSNGEMPPVGEVELAAADRARVVEWLSTEVQAASAARRARKTHSAFRRMTGYEYNYALQDLLGEPYDFAKDLPPESISEDGFQNSSELLRMTAAQLETYLDSARNALRKVTVRGERPKSLFWNISMKDAWDREWARQQDQIEKIKQEHKDDPEKLAHQLERRAARARKKPGRTYYSDLSSGMFARASWSYGGARYAWDPSSTRGEVPTTTDYFAVIPPGQQLVVELGDQVPEHGTLRVRVRASRQSDTGRTPSLRLEFGWQASNDSHASVRVSVDDTAIEASPDRPQFYQWDVPLGEVYPRNSVRGTSKMGDLPSPSELIKLMNSSVSEGDIRVDYVEIAAPIYEPWPPPSHRRIFIDSSNEADETVYAREVLARFMSRAWRRTVSASELDQKLALFATIRPTCDDFQEAMVEVLATVLSSPSFLYLVRGGIESRSGELAGSDKTPEVGLRPEELATRLSMFLWCSIPDQELLELAARGQLATTEVLTGQVQRMLDDPKSRRFSKHFVRQWLGLQLLDFLDVDRKAYPQFDRSLKEAMQEEPIAFFDHALRSNQSVLDFIHSEYTIANERLAKHYELSNVHGNYFRPVRLTEPARGGLLTQAGLLAMNSDGKDSHPLKRGIWLLESLLNDPPPPPPPAVPEIDLADPEIAKLTLKQRIEDHRNHAACLSCHAKIDPWGIAFENFDAVGAWRTQVQGKPVDASSMLFNGQQLDGIVGLKRFLLQNRQDQFVRALVDRTMTYALGRPLTFSDRASVDRIAAELREQGDGLATMVELIVTSELFTSH